MPWLGVLVKMAFLPILRENINVASFAYFITEKELLPQDIAIFKTRVGNTEKQYFLKKTPDAWLAVQNWVNDKSPVSSASLLLGLILHIFCAKVML